MESGEEREHIKPEAVSCVHENRECPCKTCLVKVTCDILENMKHCEKYQEFNMKYPTNDYWRERSENANKVQSSEDKNTNERHD
jgi:hypothetical protein